MGNEQVDDFERDLLKTAYERLIVDLFTADGKIEAQLKGTEIGYRLYAPYLEKTFQKLQALGYVETDGDDVRTRQWRITRQGVEFLNAGQEGD